MADYAEDVALVHFEGDIGEHLMVAEVFPQTVDFDHAKPSFAQNLKIYKSSSSQKKTEPQGPVL
ncbi:hypothetical protein SDC9_101962 [bioreactor metagenome]|uniref:Uncharacterized protein n=1 Tax=bioreactor metagenome TaxID=1076179 RepID=A0A645AQ04_9ZZZZ